MQVVYFYVGHLFVLSRSSFYVYVGHLLIGHLFIFISKVISFHVGYLFIGIQVISLFARTAQVSLSLYFSADYLLWT